MPESEGGESADLRRKKVQRFRRHRGIETTNRSATLDRVDVPPAPVAVAAAAKPAPPTKPAQRDLRSVTRRRNDSATGKRDKLVHKLRSGKDRFATHPTKSESEFLEEQRDVLDQSDSVMSNSSAGEHMRSVDSIMSADYSESDSKLSVATENSGDVLGDSQTAADTGAADNTAASADNAAVDSAAAAAAAAAATAMFEKHRRKGKRDKLVSKLRAGRDRSVAHASKSESSLLEEKSDALDQSGSMRSTKSAREYTQSIDSMLSADYLESDSMLAVAVNNSDEKITDDTATDTATPVINSHAEIEDDDPGDDVVDAILERQMQLLEDDESDAGSSGVDEPADSEQEPHRQRLISQIKTRKIEQKAEMQAEAERLREEKEVAAQAETYRILERKAAEARAEAEFLTRAAEKAKTGRVAKAEAARRRLEAKRSREAAERAEKERQLEEQRSIEQEAAAEKGRRREVERIVEHEAAAEKARGIEEERIVEQGAAAEKARGMEEERIVEEEAAELFEIEQSTANKSMSPAMSLKSTGDTDVGAKLNSPRKRRSPRKKRLVIQISEDSSATADDEQKGDELMGSPKTKPGINHAPNSATEKGPTDEIREHRSEGLEGSIAHREVGFHTDTQPKNVPSFDEPQDSGTEQLAFDEFLVSRRNQFDDPPSTLAAPKQGSTVHTQSTRSPEKALLEGVVSVGHGAPATRSCLFLEQLEEDSLSEDETINESIQTPKSAVVEASPTSKAAAFVSATSRNLQQSAPKEINFGHFAFPESPLAVEKQLQRAISDEQPVDESIASPNMSAGSWSSEPVTTNRGAIGKTILRTRSPEKASPEKVKEAGLIASPKKPLVSKQLQDSITDEQYEQSCDELMGSPRSTGEVRSPNSMTTTQKDSSIHILPSPQTSPNKSGPQEVELVYVAAPTSSLTIEQQASEFNADEDGPGDELMGLSPRSPFSKSIAIKIPDDDSVQVLSPDGIPDKSIYKEMHVGYVASPKSPQTGLAQLKEESSDELIGLRRSTIVEPLRSSTTSVENSIAEMQSPTKSPVVSQKSPLFAKKQKDFVTVERPVDQSLVSPRNRTPVIQSPNSIQPNGDSVAQTHSPENFEQGSATVDMGSDISLKNTQLTDEQQQPAAVDEFRDDLVHCPKSAPIGQKQQQDFTSEEVSVDELMVSPRSKVVMQLPEANGGSVVQTHSPVSLEKGPATADMGSVIFPNNTQLVEGKQEAAAVSELIDELIPSPRSISTASSLRLTSTTAESVRQVQSSESSEKCPSALIIDNIACPEQEPTIAKSHDKLVRFPKRTAAMQTSWSAIQNEDCDQVQTGGSPEKSIASGELAAAIAPSKSPKSGEQVHHSVNGSMDSPRNRGTGRSPRSMTLKESISQSESLSDPDIVGIASSSDAKITSQLIKSDTSEESVDEIMGSRKSPTVSLEKYGSQEGVVDEIQESRSIETGLKTDDNGGKAVDSSKSSSVGIQQSDFKEPLNVLMESPKGRPGIVSPKARSDERCADEISMVSSAESGVRLSPAMTTSASDVFPERDLPDQELSILAEQDQPITSTEGPSNGAGTMEEGHVDTVGLDVGVQGSNERKNSLKKELHSTSFVADSSLVQSEDLVIMHTKDVEILEGLVEEQSKAKSTSEDGRKKAVKDNTEGHFGDPESNSTVGTPPPPPPLKKRRSRRRDKKPPLEDSKSIDVVDDEKPSKPLAPAPPPPEKRASARGKRHSSPASKVRLQVITKNLSSDEMNAEPRKIGTPPPPPPLTTLSARKRRRAAANAINLEHDRNEDTETIGGSPQQKARVGEKEALQVVASKPDVDISSTCVPTPPPPPPPKRSSSKKKYRAAIRAHRSNADKATEITVTNVSTSVTPQDGAAETQESLGIPVGSREPTLNLTKEKAENHSEEATSSTASDMAPIQLAPAKIVERQMSQRQVSLPSGIEPISADESIKKDRCSDEGTALGDSSLIPKLMQGAKLIRLQLSPPMVQKSQAFDEFSTSDAADMIPMQMAAAQLVGSQLSPTLERGVTRLDERDVPMLANPSTKNVGVIEMARAAMARTQGENAPNSTETTVPYEDKLASASSDGQKLKCLVKLAISEAKNAVGREEKLSDDEAVDESSPSEKAHTKADDPFVQKERATFSQFGTDDSNSEHGQFLGSETGTASLVGAAVFDESNAEYETFRNAQIDEVATVSMTEERVVETSSNEFSQNTQKKVSQAVPSTSQEPITDSSSEYESFQFVASQKSTESVVLNSLEGDDTPANGWDTRSILEHPLDTSPSAVPDIDSSWDAARMNFTTEEKKSQDDIDIFDSVSWSHTGSDFSQSAAIAQGAKDNMTRLMLGAIVSGNHGSESNFMAAPTEEIPFEEGLWPSADGPSNIEDATKAPLPNPTKENESLLGGDGRSDIGVENISDMKTEGQLSQKERLELYTNKSAEYISSSEDDDSIADAESLAEESDADDENDDDDDEIKYISHNVEIDSDSDESSDSGGLFSRSTLEVNAATLNVADAAATLANNESRDQKHTVDGHFDGPAASTLFRIDGKQILESTSRKTPSSQVAQRAETIKTHTNRAVTAKGSMDLLPSAGINGLPKRIPLLRPPPEEKLKKWEESKLRPFKHLAARKAANATSLQGQSKLAKSGGENSTFMDFSSGIKSPLELSGVFDSVPRDLSADGNFVCIDQEMAEKAALVGSMAAELPEEKLKAGVQSDENEDIESDILQDNMASMLFFGGTGTLHENLLTKFAPKSFIGCSPNLSTGVGLKEEINSAGGIFSGWQNHPLMSLESEMLATSKTESGSKDMSCDTPATDPNFTVDISQAKAPVSEDDTLAAWLRCLVLQSDMEQRKSEDARKELRTLLEDNSHFDRVCALVSSKVSTAIMSQNEEGSGHTPMSGKVKEVIPFALGNATQRPHVLAANFVSFVQRIGKLTGITSPFKDENPFLMVLVNESIAGKKEQETDGSMQQLVFDNKGSDALEMTKFFHDVIQAATRMSSKSAEPIVEVSKQLLLDALRAAKSVSQKKRYEIAPEGTPSPFETATWSLPSAVAMLLDFLGDPVVVCRMKMVNRFCNRIISENEQTFMRDAVRLGGMSMNVRPAFWMWITLEKSSGNPMEKSLEGTMDHVKTYPVQSKISKLAQLGREGKWHGVIERDVARAFGNMPPHKTGARFRTDSIVRALVTYGRGRLIKRGVRGGGEAPPISRIATPDGLLPKSKSRSRSSVAPPPWLVGDDGSEGSDASETPTDTVSDWGCVSPVASFTSSVGDEVEIKRQSSRRDAQESISEGEQMQVSRDPAEELALGGNALTHEMKTKLQNQLEFILHTLAAEHDDVGYCQGMDYVVAHLLRILQDTVKWHAMKGCLPSVIIGAEKLAKPLADGSTAVSDEAIAESLVVEEAVFRVMDCFFTTYNLRHIYWPELRSLKICCRVFERLIQHKLPVLADHFEHHELNVGLFALGWFQTLYLYLPSMPAATVCHMWDIWLVERSFKIFFRVGTAILFLSQPILLNHDLEGMMTYLNTFPDATLLKPDILIACALQIKVTNRMLTELETEVTGGL